MHFVHEDTLSDDGSAELERKDGRVLPISRHHFADCETLAMEENTAFHGSLAVDFLDDRSVRDSFLNKPLDVVHGWPVCRVWIDELEDVGAEFHADKAVGKGVRVFVPVSFGGCFGATGAGREDCTS